MRRAYHLNFWAHKNKNGHPNAMKLIEATHAKTESHETAPASANANTDKEIERARQFQRWPSKDEFGIAPNSVAAVLINALAGRGEGRREARRTAVNIAAFSEIGLMELWCEVGAGL